MVNKSLQKKNDGTALKTLYQWLPISIILVVATCIFTYQLGREGFWIDEFYSMRDAAIFQKNPLEGYKDNRVRPLFYVLLSIWMRFGSGDAWLRSLSVIFAIISVFLIYRLGRRLLGENEGLIAATLLMTSPYFISHAQQVRMYDMSVCMGLAGALFLANALLTERHQRPSQKALAGWALFRLLAILTFPLNLTLLIPDALMIFWRFRREPAVLITFGKWLLLLLLLWSPAVASAVGQASSTSEYSISRAQYVARPGLNNLVFPLKFWMVQTPVVLIGPKVHLFYKLFTLPIFGLIGAALIQKHKSPALFWIGAWLVIPLIPIIVVSRFAAQLWEPRYILFVCPYLFLLLAAGFTRLWRQWKPTAIVIAAIYVVAIGGALAQYFTVQNNQDFRFNIETIQQYDQPGDAIVWGYPWDIPKKWRTPLDYYYKGDAEAYWLPMRDFDKPGDVSQWLSQFPTGYKRLWVVLEDPKKVVKKDSWKLAAEVREAIAKDYNIEATYSYEQNSKVMLITPRSKPSVQSSSTP